MSHEHPDRFCHKDQSLVTDWVLVSGFGQNTFWIASTSHYSYFARMAIHPRELSPNDNMQLFFGICATIIGLIMIFLKLKCWKRRLRLCGWAKLRREAPSLPLHSTATPTSYSDESHRATLAPTCHNGMPSPENAPFSSYPSFSPSSRTEPNVTDATRNSGHIPPFQDHEELWMTESRTVRVGRTQFRH